MSVYTYIAVGVIILVISCVIIVRYIKNPFKYPTVTTKIDLTGRRKPSYNDCIEEWVIEQFKSSVSLDSIYQQTMQEWTTNCNKQISKAFLFKNRRKKQFDSVNQVARTGNCPMFTFVFYRIHSNREDVEKVTVMTLQQMSDLDDQLAAINYKATQTKYNAQDQRKLMTGALRQKIKDRDNYTCRICGISKQFLDDLCPGLGDYLLFEIDHVQAVSQGGVTVDDDNLQCLCWRCNRAKGGSKTNQDVKNSIDYGIEKLRRNLRR